MTPDEILAKVREIRAQLLPASLPPEPPPGKVRVMAHVPVTYVSQGQIAAYLRAHGWGQDGILWRRHSGHATHFSDDTTVEVLEHYVLRCIADAENRSTGEVLRDIAQMGEP